MNTIIEKDEDSDFELANVSVEDVSLIIQRQVSYIDKNEAKISERSDMQFTYYNKTLASSLPPNIQIGTQYEKIGSIYKSDSPQNKITLGLNYNLRSSHLGKNLNE